MRHAVIWRRSSRNAATEKEWVSQPVVKHEEENEGVGSKRESEQDEVRCEVLFRHTESRFQKISLRIVLRNVLRMGLVLARVWERTSRWHCAYRNIEVEAADGGSSRQGRVCFFVAFHGGK